MKKVFIAVALILLAAIVYAGSGLTGMNKLVIENIDTGSYTQSTDSATSSKITGFLEGFYVRFSGSTGRDVDFDVVTVQSNGIYTVAERYLLSIDDMTADEAYYPVRLAAQTYIGSDLSTGTTNTFVRIPLVNDQLRLKAYDAAATNANIWVTPIILKP